ncbi:MAG: hypothetical protein ACK6CT_12210 [Planctomycetia bacterium]
MSFSPPAADGSARGRLVVALIVVLGICLAMFAFWYQWRQTRRCLDFLGAAVAGDVSRADRVELWRLGPGSGPRRLAVTARYDVSRAPGLVHLRHALVEDASFIWEAVPPAGDSGPRPVPEWATAIAFSRHGDAKSPPATVLAFDRQFGTMTVVGRPGRVALGRLGSGLDRWVRLVVQPAGPAMVPGTGPSTVSPAGTVR